MDMLSTVLLLVKVCYESTPSRLVSRFYTLAMKKRITGAKIACLDINLQKARMQLGVQILVDDPNQLEEIRKRLVAHTSCGFEILM